MSAALYLTGLWFYVDRGGRAKLRGSRQELRTAPVLEGVGKLAEIEYVPEVRVYRLRLPTEGWREMTAAEIRAADAWLVDLFAAET